MWRRRQRRCARRWQCWWHLRGGGGTSTGGGGRTSTGSACTSRRRHHTFQVDAAASPRLQGPVSFSQGAGGGWPRPRVALPPVMRALQRLHGRQRGGPSKEAFEAPLEEDLGASPGDSDDKVSACNAVDLGSIPGLGRSPGEGNGYPLQYSCLENSIDREGWWAIVHGVTKNQTRATSVQFSWRKTPPVAGGNWSQRNAVK